MLAHVGARFVVVEQLLHLLEFIPILLDQGDVLRFQVALNEVAFEQVGKGVDQFKCRSDRRAVVESHVENPTEDLLQPLDGLRERREVGRKLGLRDVKDVIPAGLPLVELSQEVAVNICDIRCELMPFVAADVNALETVKVRDRLDQIQQVIASLKKGVQPREERGVLKLPRVVGAFSRGLHVVLVVDRFELGTDAKCLVKARDGLGRVVFKKRRRVNVILRLINHVIADLADEHRHTWRGVVVFGMLPHHEQQVHDGWEEFGHLVKVVKAPQILEVGHQWVEELDVVSCLRLSGAHLCDERREGGEVRTLGHFEHLHYLADVGALELLHNALQIASLLHPKLDALHRAWIAATLQYALRVGLEHSLDLVGPGDDSRLEHVDAVLVLGRTVSDQHVGRRLRQQRLAH
mmetsp:Transcript_2360/g.7767  ORF Transcript_2360/g.7767 Transcript_2360/m.7767 type:complete len:407 (-) Transcript_2360:492-1712(-)